MVVNYCYKIFLNLARTCVPYFLKFFIKLKLYNSIAILLVILVKINTFFWYKKNQIQKKRKPYLKNILSFDRVIFDRDMVEVLKRTDLYIQFFHNEHYTFLADAILDSKIRNQMDYSGSSDESKLLFYNLLKHIFNKFQYLLKFDVILNSNFIYYQDFEWARLCKHLNFPFLTLCKEVPNTISNEQKWIQDWYNFKYYGTAMAVYSDWTKTVLRDECNIGKKDKFQVVGCPRTDPIFDIFSKNKNMDRALVVFFDFMDHPKKTMWNEAIKAYALMAKEAKYHKKYKFLLKTKYKEHEIFIRNHLKSNNIESKQLIISHDFDILDIARRAKVICGFRTTSLIKFMKSDLPIIIFNWGEAKDEVEDNLIPPELGDSCILCDELENFTFYIDKILRSNNYVSNYNRKHREILIEKNLYKIDGNRSKEFESFVLNHT